ncbi:energy-coupling factor transport system ATP-binding protein [Bacillus horti]|uniref:Energy-coupling factor transporter ATP-binding protein EcfA2 n=1 Tax=Caldalkalibacillus horti TaxID=77523 RepID=A0ABT9VZR3_9BACI|nr:energy-coupling factor transport system ATP-binding protein [Bacillus horti]
MSYTYHAHTPFEQQVLKDISLEIKENLWVSIIGRTGSGKSTLVQHMNGLSKPTEGSVQIGQTVIASDQKKRLDKPLYDQVGMVFQYPEHQLFEESVFKDISYGPRNLEWPTELIELRVLQVMGKLGLPRDLAERSPFQLSGGQKRRVAIAGILVMNPKVIILDEPTAGLDPQGKRDILKVIRQWQEEHQSTVITITHQMEDVAEFADQVVVMEHGRVKWQMDPFTLFTTYGSELEQMGLELPQLIQFIKELNEGYDSSHRLVPTSLNQNKLYEQIATFLKGNMKIAGSLEDIEDETR